MSEINDRPRGPGRPPRERIGASAPSVSNGEAEPSKLPAYIDVPEAFWCAELGMSFMMGRHAVSSRSMHKGLINSVEKGLAKFVY